VVAKSLVAVGLTELNGYVIGDISPASFRSLMVPFISAVMQSCFSFTILIGREESKVVYLVFPAIFILIPLAGQPMSQFCQLPNISIPNSRKEE
jgi:hypothetical protein